MTKEEAYQILNISYNASKSDIKEAYHKEIKKYHPDLHTDNPLKDLAEEKLKTINEAYQAINTNKYTYDKNSHQKSDSNSNNSDNAKNNASYTKNEKTNDTKPQKRIRCYFVGELNKKQKKYLDKVRIMNNADDVVIGIIPVNKAYRLLINFLLLFPKAIAGILAVVGFIVDLIGIVVGYVAGCIAVLIFLYGCLECLFMILFRDLSAWQNFLYWCDLRGIFALKFLAVVVVAALVGGLVFWGTVVYFDKAGDFLVECWCSKTKEVSEKKLLEILKKRDINIVIDKS